MILLVMKATNYYVAMPTGGTDYPFVEDYFEPLLSGMMKCLSSACINTPVLFGLTSIGRFNGLYIIVWYGEMYVMGLSTNRCIYVGADL